MRARRRVGAAMLGAAWLGGALISIASCDAGVPPSGSRAVVAADHLERQQPEIERIRTGMKPRPSTSSVVGR